MKLTLRQSRFVEEYLQSGNGSQAVIKAGYASHPNSAAVQSHRLLRNVKVVGEIARRQAEIERITNIDRQAVAKMYQTIYDTAIKGPRPSYGAAIAAVVGIARLFGFIKTGRRRGKKW